MLKVTEDWLITGKKKTGYLLTFKDGRVVRTDDDFICLLDDGVVAYMINGKLKEVYTKDLAKKAEILYD